MLKIKENVGLKELEKLGFKPKYSEDTGEIDSYIKKIDEFEGLIFKQERKIIRFFQKEYGLWLNEFYNYIDVDIYVDALYDLIKADMVEKVG